MLVVATILALTLGFVLFVPLIHSHIIRCGGPYCIYAYTDVSESIGCYVFGFGASYVPRYQFYGNLTFQWGCDQYFGGSYLIP